MDTKMGKDKPGLNYAVGPQPIEADVTVGYSDNDIILIDNAKLLAKPVPARSQMNVVAFCYKGKAQMEMNGTMTHFEENQLLVCPPNVSFSNFMLSPDFEFKAIFVTNRILQSFLREKMRIWTDTFYVRRLHVISIDDDDIAFLRHFYDMLHIFIYPSKSYAFSDEIVQSLLHGAFLGLCSLVKGMPSMEETGTRQRGNSDKLFKQFMDLLSSTAVKHQPVEWYADELCITPKYLTLVCKSNSGKTANEWIRESVLEDIRYYLKSTDLSFKQICDQIGFSTPSFFGRYVKEHFGMTPTQFRSQ